MTRSVLRVVVGRMLSYIHTRRDSSSSLLVSEALGDLQRALVSPARESRGQILFFLAHAGLLGHTGVNDLVRRLHHALQDTDTHTVASGPAAGMCTASELRTSRAWPSMPLR